MKTLLALQIVNQLLQKAFQYQTMVLNAQKEGREDLSKEELDKMVDDYDQARIELRQKIDAARGL